MDAAYNVEAARTDHGPSVSGDAVSAEIMREQVYRTLSDLQTHLKQLQDFTHRRFGSVNNPLHLRDRVVARPITACSVALGLGLIFGLFRAHRAPVVLLTRGAAFTGSIARSVGKSIGSQIVSNVMQRMTL